jgi:hypothetical protein
MLSGHKPEQHHGVMPSNARHAEHGPRFAGFIFYDLHFQILITVSGATFSRLVWLSA